MITLQLDPHVRVRFGDAVVDAVLEGEPTIYLARISADPPTYAQVRLPELRAPAVRVVQVVTETRIEPPRVRPWTFRAGVGTSFRFAAPVQPATYGFGEIERHMSERAFCRVRGEVHIGGERRAAVECGVQW